MSTIKGDHQIMGSTSSSGKSDEFVSNNRFCSLFISNKKMNICTSSSRPSFVSIMAGIFLILSLTSCPAHCQSDTIMRSHGHDTQVVHGPVEGDNQRNINHENNNYKNHVDVDGQQHRYVQSRVPMMPSMALTSPEYFCEKFGDCSGVPASISDKSGFEAIRWLHRQLDDDADGNVNIEETGEFLKEELKYDDRKSSDKNKKFHGNDGQISVEELWTSWTHSKVYNWTTEEVLDWLATSVELPQYRKAFFINEVNGSFLPRLASNPSFLQGTLKIKDPIHRQKISLKAMDVVLFGPSNGSKSQWIKDLIAVFSVIVGITLSIYSYYVLKGSKVHVSKMMKDMESLQKSEAQLSMLQEELDRAMDERKNIFNEKSKLEERLMKEIEKLESNSMMSKSMSDNDLSSSCPNIYEKDVDSRVAALERELKETREQLEQANKSWTPPHQLQLWLQLTHELEVKAYNIKKAAAEHALLAAKDGCEKLRRKRQAFMGSFRVAHGSSLDEVDNRIVAAKGALSEVTKDLHERLTRWRQIEKLTGLDIVNNPGLESLQSSLVISSLPGFAGHVQTPSSDGTSSITRTNSDGTIHSNEDTFM